MIQFPTSTQFRFAVRASLNFRHTIVTNDFAIRRMSPTGKQFHFRLYFVLLLFLQNVSGNGGRGRTGEKRGGGTGCRKKTERGQEESEEGKRGIGLASTGSCFSLNRFIVGVSTIG